MDQPTGRQRFDAVVRSVSGQVLATLIRYFGDFDIAEECLADAWLLAAERWPVDGFPDEPAAWVTTVARRRGIDRVRRERQRADRQSTAHWLLDQRDLDLDVLAEERWTSGVEDDRLRLIFTCCHPALPADSQVPLTLREVCDLKTEEIARAYLATPSTIAQRIVRAKAKIRDAKIPYQVPEAAELPERLASVLRVIYLVFNEGYSASAGDSLTRTDLSAEAIRLGRQLLELLPEAEVMEYAKETGATPFHHPKAELRHTGTRTGFDALRVHFDLQDPALGLMARILRGGETNDKNLTQWSPGFAAIGSGLRNLVEDDETFIAIMALVLDGLYRYCQDQLAPVARPTVERRSE